MPIPDAYDHEIEAANAWTKKCHRKECLDTIKFYAGLVICAVAWFEIVLINLGRM